jgi:hypothetical protein
MLRPVSNINVGFENKYFIDIFHGYIQFFLINILLAHYH